MSHTSNEALAQAIFPGVVRQLAMRHYVDSVGRSDIYTVPASWWLEEMKMDKTIVQVAFADELLAALANHEIDSVMLVKAHHITRPQLYNLLKSSSLGITVFVEA